MSTTFWRLALRLQPGRGRGTEYVLSWSVTCIFMDDMKQTVMHQQTRWSRVLLGNLGHSASREIPRLLWNLKVHCRVHKSPPLVPILRQMHPVHIFLPCFNKFHVNIILPSMFRSFELSLPLRLPTNNFYSLLISPMHATCPAHLILLDLITLIIFCEAHKLWSSSLQPPATYSSNWKSFTAHWGGIPIGMEDNCGMNSS
jgi:hypothetical protein